MKKEYVLKHQNIPVLTFYMDDVTHKLLGNGEILEKDRLPFNMQDIDNDARLIIQTDTWLKCRGLAESRKDLQQVKELFDEKESKSLAIKSLGLNLTDHYWVHKTEDNYDWEKANHFDNNFDTIIQPDNFELIIDGSVKKPSPNLCVDGSIVKRWMIKGDSRVLIKGSRYSWMQEPFNERIASMIMAEFKIPHINYDLRRTKENIPYSECECMVDRNTEYINAQWVFNLEDYGSKTVYDHYIDIMKRNSITDAKERVDEMIAIDFLMGNEDRHRGNFGIIRDAQTLKWIKIADIFDNGNSLLYDCSSDDLNTRGIDTMCKSFENSNRLALNLIDYPQWWSNANGGKIIEITSECLKNNERMSPQRYDTIIKLTKERVDIFEKSINQNNPAPPPAKAGTP